MSKGFLCKSSTVTLVPSRCSLGSKEQFGIMLDQSERCLVVGTCSSVNLIATKMCCIIIFQTKDRFHQEAKDGNRTE